MKMPPWLALSGNILKICAIDALKMHSLALSVPRFPCKTFSSLSGHNETLVVADIFLKVHLYSNKKYGYMYEQFLLALRHLFVALFFSSVCTFVFKAISK